MQVDRPLFSLLQLIHCPVTNVHAPAVCLPPAVVLQLKSSLADHPNEWTRPAVGGSPLKPKPPSAALSASDAGGGGGAGAGGSIFGGAAGAAAGAGAAGDGTGGDGDGLDFSQVASFGSLMGQ